MSLNNWICFILIIGGFLKNFNKNAFFQAVLNRLSQVKPKILFTIDRFPQEREEHDMLPKLKEIAEGKIFLHHIFFNKDTSFSCFEVSTSDIFLWSHFLLFFSFLFQRCHYFLKIHSVVYFSCKKDLNLCEIILIWKSCAKQN